MSKVWVGRFTIEVRIDKVNMAFFESFCCLMSALKNLTPDSVAHAYGQLMSD